MNKLVFSCLLLLFFPFVLLIVIAPMSNDNQAIFGLICIAIVFVLGVSKSKKNTLIMIVMSAVMSLRYIYWRAMETLSFSHTVEAVLGSALFMAEVYALVILLLGYLQTTWSLKRRIEPLPNDVSLWPTVDVYIPSYNEDLEVVRDTVLAAQCMDYPRDKIKIYLLDDGRRNEFAVFCADVGVGYITRSDNQHAKAGNLNNAMTLTRSELITVFDSDHVATRAFLQATVGSFLVDERLALIQTPHHFYSPDPFERNLSAARNVPNEGALFYGPVQQGNDNWNATFFCGSCAVIRRTALDEVGGFAVETVTEDAHTALKMQRRGWNTAFLALPLAAGLATERLGLHVIQRTRWARGMTQIFRVDNPLLGRGLLWQQRLCYLNAMLHFQYGLPRVIFYISPLFYLLFNLNIIASSAGLIFVYVLPHLVMSIYINSRTNGRYRHSFWGEIYETVMCFHLVIPTLRTLISPKHGKFNVTDKGALLDSNYFDFHIVRPHIITAVLLLFGIVWGGIRLWMPEHYGADPQVILLNIAWASSSMVILLAAIAVAKETRQVRKTIRIDAALPAVLYFASGATLRTQTLDLSMGGVKLKTPDAGFLEDPIEEVGILLKSGVVSFPVDLMKADQAVIRLMFKEMSIEKRRALVRVVLARADTWIRTQPYAQDRPLRSLLGISRCIFELFFLSWFDHRAKRQQKKRSEIKRSPDKDQSP
jgi:cellulose synthase (UDP-forming)